MFRRVTIMTIMTVMTVFFVFLPALAQGNTFTFTDNYFPSFADSHTAALWLFDEPDYPHTTLTDASEYEKADLCLMEGGSMVAGRFGRALQVGSGYAVCYAGFAGKVPEEELRGPDGFGGMLKMQALRRS